MTTLTYKGIEYNVILVDSSITKADGDGSTTENALKDLPDALTNNTCYLFRRLDDAEVLVKHQIDASLQNIMFLGMPKNTDPQWIQNLVTDEAINDAWKADEAHYARVRFWHRSDNIDTNSLNRACLYLQNITYATFINCYLYRHDSSSGASSSTYWGAVSPFLTDGANTSPKLRLGLYGCKIGVYGIDLDQDSYLAEATGPDYKDTNNVAQYYSKWARQYFNIHTADCVEIDNCVINGIVHNRIGTNSHTQYGSSNYYFQGGQAIYVDNCISFKLTNSTINAAFETGNSALGYEDAIFIDNSMKSENKCFVSIHHVQYNCICGTNGVAALCNIDMSSYNNAAVIGITEINITPKKFNHSYGGNLTYDACGIGLYTSYGYKQLYIDNIKMDATGSVKLTQCIPLRLSIMGQSAGNQHSGEIRNIDIKLSDDPAGGIYALSNNLKSVADFNFNFGTNGSSYNDLTTSGYSDSSNYRSRYNVLDYPVLENLNINAPYGKVCFNRVIANLGDLRCGVEVNYACAIDINKLTFDKSNLQGINVANGGNYLRIRDYEVNLPIQDTLQLNQNFWSNSVYIDKSNVNLFNMVVTNVTDTRYLHSLFCCLNMIQPGRYFARNVNTFAQSWGVTRAGSTSSACLKLNCNTNANFPLMIGGSPFKGFSVTPDSSGKKYLTAYFAHKNFDAISLESGKHEFNLIVRVPKVIDNEKNTIAYTTFISTPDDWYEDNSEWSDDGCEAKKIMVPIEVSSTSLPIEVKLSYNWYHATGVVYLDPEFHIVNDLSR